MIAALRAAGTLVVQTVTSAAEDRLAAKAAWTCWPCRPLQQEDTPARSPRSTFRRPSP